MACSTAETTEDGFATPAATMISLALGLSAVAVMSASMGQLKLARADFGKAQIENTLAGEHQRAILAVLGSEASGVLRWSQPIGGQFSLDITAEPEAPKASLVSAIAMDDSVFAKLAVADPKALKERLKTLSIADALGGELEAADPSPIWKACARSLMSPFGLSEQLRLFATQAPASDSNVGRHAGEVWRLRVSDKGGWTDDRVIRFTGDSLHPAATLERRFAKLGQEGKQCDSMLENAG